MYSESREFYELRIEFERTYKTQDLTREPKELSTLQRWYANGETNKMFIAFMHGYQVSRSIHNL